MSIRLRSEPISRDLPDVMAVNSSDQWLNGVSLISWRKTFLLIRVRFRVAENLRSARSSLSFFSKVLAARKTNLITCPELAKINALLACSQRPFITPHTAQSSSSVVGFFSLCRIFTTTWCPLFWKIRYAFDLFQSYFYLTRRKRFHSNSFMNRMVSRS